MSATAPAARGLSFMQALSSHVYLWRPSPDRTSDQLGAKDPALIIIFGWMNANGGTLAKYVRQHQLLFPSSAILLVTCTFAGMTLPFLGLPEARIAATTARAILEQDAAQREHDIDAEARPRLLLHVLSNAGSTMLSAVWVAVTILRIPDHIGDLAPRAHNNPALASEACRVYIYGPVDRITPAVGVQRHADNAEARGFNVRRDVFLKTGHVAHAREEAERYWGIVRQIWEEAGRGDRHGPQL